MNESVRNPSERHYPALDGLRGVAALMIVWYHYLLIVPMHGRVLSLFSQVFGFGWAGVDLFFGLSGFLITGILIDSKNKPHYFRTFYSRRVLRIFPLYYGYIAIVFYLLPFIGVVTNVPSSSRIFFWTYTSNFYFQSKGWVDSDILRHFWTLAIEEQFYLVWPLIIFLVKNMEYLRQGFLWAFISVALVRFFLFFENVDFNTLQLNTLTHCDALIFGGYLALSIRSKNLEALKWIEPHWIVAALTVMVTLFLADFGSFVPCSDAIPEIAFGRSVLMFSFLSLIIVWLIDAVTNQSHGYFFRFFSHPILRWIGKYSYSLYVLHVPFALLILRSHPSWLSSVPISSEIELFFIYFVCSILSAFLSWHLFEKHFLKLKRFFQYSQAA